ncbi:MAG: response regulator [Deltaproteobacteria bacterium]|jgi:signal transduction histidine kinase/CheY-like chemotaxis protein|nr:response regulator [Deltaproteobacteria bacterium]
MADNSNNQTPDFIKSKTVFALFLVSAAAILIFSVYSRIKFGEHLAYEEKNLVDRLILASRMAAEHVSGEELNKYTVREDIDRPGYKALKDRLVRLAGTMDVDFVYYFRQTGDKIQYIVDSDTDPHTSTGLQWEPVDLQVEQGFEGALAGQVTTSGRERHSVNRSNSVASYAPVFDSQGKVVAVAGVDLDGGHLNSAALIMTVLTVLIIGAAVAIIFCGFYFHRQYAREVQQVRRADRAKSLFLARMSHEIRTPMNAIVGLSELLMRQAQNLPTQIHTYIRNIKQAGANLLSIINDILDFSKIESGNFEILPDQYSLSILVDDILNIIKVRLLEKPVRIIIFLDSRLPDHLVGDATRVRQILLNLMANAVKYTREGSISLSVTCQSIEDKELVLKAEVADTGIGIKPEDMSRLFGDFIQLDQGENKNIEGTGLGLAIARNLCQLMGGDIKVKSEYGQGSVFTVTLPQKIENPAPVAVVGGADKKAVVVFERRAIYAQSLSASLENLGVGYYLVNNYPKFYEALGDFEYTHMIMPVSVFIGLQNSLKERNITVPVGLTTEDIHPFGLENARYLFTPIYSRPLAAFLNNVPDQPEKLEYGQGQAGANFIAPRARILIVDDLPTNLMVAEGLFFPYAMRIDLCRSGSEAINLVKDHEYDMIFMDHMMPEMDGVEATRQIRALGEKYQKLPIVAMTANAVSGMREMFLSLGLDDFLTKPIETVMLNTILLRWIPIDKQEKVRPASEQKNLLAQTTMALPRIEGLDVTLGLSRANGQREAYLTTLEYFRKDALTALSNLNASLEAREYKNFTVHIHALKSAAGVTGAVDLAARAAALEAASVAGAEGFIASNIASFRQDLIQLIDGLTRYFEEIKLEAQNKQQLGDEEIKKELALLRQSIATMESEHVDLALKNLLERSAAGELKKDLAELARQFQESGPESAAALLDRMLPPDTVH